MGQPEPDFLPYDPPTVPVPVRITCENCGYTILSMERDFTQDELDRGLDIVLSDLRAQVKALTDAPLIHQLSPPPAGEPE